MPTCENAQDFKVEVAQFNMGMLQVAFTSLTDPREPCARYPAQLWLVSFSLTADGGIGIMDAGNRWKNVGTAMTDRTMTQRSNTTDGEVVNSVAVGRGISRIRGRIRLLKR